MRFLLGITIILSILWGEQANLPLGILTSINGSISIVRSQTKASIQAKPLDYIFDGDTLVIGVTSSVTIFYKTGKLQMIEDNVRSFVSTENATSGYSLNESGQKQMSALFDELYSLKKTYDNLVIEDKAKTEDAAQLIIQYPGNTALLDPRPDIIWNKYAGANWYTMRIKRGSEIISNIATTDTVFSYPENEDDMLPGNYKIKVLAVHNSDTLSTTTRSLTILDSLSIQYLDKTIRLIAQQKPDDFTFYLLKAVFYRKKLLRLMAVESFEKLLTLCPGLPILYRGLAEIYNELGMVDLGHAFFNLSKQTIVTPEIRDQ